jgi:hypothetical protein
MNVEEALKELGLQARQPEAQCLVKGLSGLTIILDRSSWENHRPIAERLMINEAWRKHLLTHPKDFDGSLVSVKDIFNQNGNIGIIVRASKFSSFVATRSRCLGKRIMFLSCNLDKDYTVPLSFGMVAKTLSTKENPKGCIIAAIRGNTAFDGGRATFLPGGYINLHKKKYWPIVKVPQRKNACLQIPLDQQIEREFREELPWMRYSPPELLGIVHSLTDSCQPAIVGRMDLSVTAEEIMKFCTKRTQEEIKEIICVPADIDSLREFVKRNTLCIHDVYKIAFYLADATEKRQY